MKALMERFIFWLTRDRQPLETWEFVGFSILFACGLLLCLMLGLLIGYAIFGGFWK